MLSLILGSLAFVIVRSRSDIADITRTEDTDQSLPDSDAEIARETTEAGVYQDYSDEALSSATGKILLFFHAPWCPQCRELESDIKQDGVPADTTILKVDYDTSQKLRQKYGVTIQTTIVEVTASGELVKKFVAYDDPSVESLVANFL